MFRSKNRTCFCRIENSDLIWNHQLYFRTNKAINTLIWSCLIWSNHCTDSFPRSVVSKNSNYCKLVQTESKSYSDLYLTIEVLNTGQLILYIRKTRVVHHWHEFGYLGNVWTFHYYFCSCCFFSFKKAFLDFETDWAYFLDDGFLCNRTWVPRNRKMGQKLCSLEDYEILWDESPKFLGWNLMAPAEKFRLILGEKSVLTRWRSQPTKVFVLTGPCREHL